MNIRVRRLAYVAVVALLAYAPLSAQTRTVLGLALSACANAPLEEVGYGVFRM